MKTTLAALTVALVVLSAQGRTANAGGAPPDPQQELALISKIRAQLGSNLADAIAAQEQLRQSLASNVAQQRDTETKISDADAKIADLDNQIALAQQHEGMLSLRIESERDQLRQLARAEYESPGSVLLVLAEAQGLGDLLGRISDLSVAGSRATQLKSSLSNDLADLQRVREAEQAAREDEAKQRAALADELTQLKSLQKQQERSMAELQVKIQQTQTELYLLSRQSSQLAQQITDMLQAQEDAIIAAAMQAVWAQLQLWLQANNVGTIPPSAGHSTKYRFIWPEPQAHISQGFGPTTFWFEPPYGAYPHFHTGIDLVEPFGSPVYAADDGVVALVGNNANGYGNYVVIAHSGGFNTLYGHLSTALVKVGQTVTQGMVVGLEGSTGNSTGPHLHFELRINQKAIDPTPYLPPGAPSSFRG